MEDREDVVPEESDSSSLFDSADGEDFPNRAVEDGDLVNDEPLREELFNVPGMDDDAWAGVANVVAAFC